MFLKIWTHLEDLRLNNPHPRAMKSWASLDPGFLFEHHQSSSVVVFQANPGRSGWEWESLQEWLCWRDLWGGPYWLIRRMSGVEATKTWKIDRMHGKNLKHQLQTEQVKNRKMNGKLSGKMTRWTSGILQTQDTWGKHLEMNGHTNACGMPPCGFVHDCHQGSCGNFLDSWIVLRNDSYAKRGMWWSGKEDQLVFECFGLLAQLLWIHSKLQTRIANPAEQSNTLDGANFLLHTPHIATERDCEMNSIGTNAHLRTRQWEMLWHLGDQVYCRYTCCSFDVCTIHS